MSDPTFINSSYPIPLLTTCLSFVVLSPSNPSGEVQERIVAFVGSHRHIRGLFAAGEVTGGGKVTTYVHRLHQKQRVYSANFYSIPIHSLSSWRKPPWR